MRIWRRIARLFDQSRIRLPAQPVRASELHPGDWLSIGFARWRVRARRHEGDRLIFRLDPLYGSTGAVLVSPRGGTGEWRFWDEGGREVSLPPELLVVFPVV